MTMEGNAAPPDFLAPPEIRVGQLYENPVTGERGIVRVPPVAANDGLLVADLYLRLGGAVAAEHVHPHIAEAFTVVRGHLQVRHSGHELRVGPGDRTLVALGVAGWAFITLVVWAAIAIA